MNPLHILSKYILALGSVVLVGPSGIQAATVTVQPSTAAWNGFMNVFELPANGGAFVFGSGWGVADLNSSFNDGLGTLTLSPNTIGDPNQFWYQNTSGTAPDPANPGGPGQLGNKIMEANLYREVTDGLSGQSVVFMGDVSAFSLTSAYRNYAIIKDFAPDYSSVTESRVEITGTGPFSVELTTLGDPGRHVQYGFQTVGANVWVTDVAPFGSVTIATVPEPSTATLGLIGAAALLRRRR